MQHLNNDMEELFRKAADNYPLKSDGLDFNKILAGLATDQEDAVSKKKFRENKKFRKFLWLLLLLSFGYICLLQLNTFKTGNIAGNHQLKENEIAIKNQEHPENLQKKNVPLKGGNTKKDSEHNAISNLSPLKSEHALPRLAAAPTGDNADDPAALKADHINNVSAQNKALLFFPDQSIQTGSNKLSFLAPEIFSSNQEIVKKGNYLYEVSMENKLASANLADVHPSIVFRGKSAAKNSAFIPDSSSARAKITGNRQHKVLNRFYAGLLAGVDFSTVKFQSIQHTGFNIGVLAGYQLNRKFSIETGLWWDRKKYYSDGKYLNTIKLNLPYNVKVIDLNGSCDMFEIPLNIRYNISDHKKGKLFTTAGISSYIMKNEDYNYAAENMGNYYNAYNSYKNGARNFLSVMHASVGYEYPVGKAGKIRMEPYVKIPLHGLGTGSLPIMSTGINVGFTPKFK